jgi:hypothetical protein
MCPHDYGVLAARPAQGSKPERIIREVTDPRFNNPTAVSRHGNTLYLTNAYFTAADPANTDYAITAIPDPA